MAFGTAGEECGEHLRHGYACRCLVLGGQDGRAETACLHVSRLCLRPDFRKISCSSEGAFVLQLNSMREAAEIAKDVGFSRGERVGFF